MLIGSVDMSITVCLFVGSGVDLQMPPKNSGGAKKHKTFDHFFATSALDTAYLERTKMLVSVYNMSRKSWPTFRHLWPKNGLDPFAYFDPPFGGHYVATVKVATYLVSNYVSDLNVTYYCRLKEPIVQLLYGTKKRCSRLRLGLWTPQMNGFGWNLEHWVHCRGLALADSGRDTHSRDSFSLRDIRNFCWWRK